MSSNSKLHFLQAVRAVAAWLVIADHALVELTHKQPGDRIVHVAWTLGSSGVYLFFIISGFIMVHISWQSFGRDGAALEFLRRRIIRIVPLYWIATVTALAYHLVSATHGAHVGLSELLSSLAFIPYQDRNGIWAPIVTQGWTLSYEMMFYAVFAACLLLSRRIALPAVGIILAMFVVVGPLQPYATVSFFASPIVLWFVLGMALAALWHARGFDEPEWLSRWAEPLEPLGDASYSTYLAHGLVLTMLFRVWTIVAGPPTWWIVPVSLAVATLAGWAIHLIIERPLLRLVNSLLKPHRRVSTAMNVPKPSR